MILTIRMDRFNGGGSAGWSIEPGTTIGRDDRLPVKFIRSAAMQALPLPASEQQDDPDRGELGGPIWRLRDLINPKIGDDDFLLIVGFIVAAFHPRGPYPVLAIDGVQGSGKSTLSRTVRKLIDPNKAFVRGAPKDMMDLTVQAMNAWVVSMDNQSGVPPWLSDGLCSVSTGQGHSTRELYTNGGEVVFNNKRPMIVNGIERLVERFDLADRSIMIELPEFKERKYLPEEKLDADFAEAAPAIFGAVLDALVWAVRDHRTIRDVDTRMVSMVNWIEAGAPGLGFQRGEFEKAYLTRRGEVVVAGIDRDPVASAIEQLMKACAIGLSEGMLPDLLREMTKTPTDMTTWPIQFSGGMLDSLKDAMWRGTPTQLLKILMTIGGDPDNSTKSWPSANSLWGRITRCLPLLRTRGIEITRNKSGDRNYTITCPYQRPGENDLNGSPWENGYCESFNARFRDELLNGEIFYSLKEAQTVIEEWRKHYNTVRPHSALGYRPPAPEAIIPLDHRPSMH